MEVENWSIDKFNKVTGCNLLPQDTFFIVAMELEVANVNYFYTSMRLKDVLEAINNEKEVAEQLGVYVVFIVDLGVYIGLY